MNTTRTLTTLIITALLNAAPSTAQPDSTINGTVTFEAETNLHAQPDAGAAVFVVPANSLYRIDCDLYVDFSSTTVALYRSTDTAKRKAALTFSVLASTTADENGHFSLGIAPGNYLVFVKSANSTRRCNRDHTGKVMTALLHVSRDSAQTVIFGF